MKNTLEALRIFDEGAAAREAAWRNLSCNADAEAAYEADMKALDSLRVAFYEDTKDSNRNNLSNCRMLSENYIRYAATGKPRAASINLGAVGFGKLTGKVDKDGSPDWQYFSLIGDKRVKLLRLAYEGKPLPDGLLLIGQVGNGGGFIAIASEAVNWASSGIPQHRG